MIRQSGPVASCYAPAPCWFSKPVCISSVCEPWPAC